MTNNNLPKAPLAALDLPVQDLTKLTFCGSSKAARVQEWAEQLQATRISQTSVLLYKNLPEITRLKTDAKNRLAMLEALRPVVQNCIGGLAQQFLGQPLILPDDAQKKVIVAQALQRSMINGYSLCARDLASKKHLSSQDKASLALTINRALVGTGWLYLRNCQIYTQLPKGLWTHIHALFCTAEHFELLDLPVQDSLLERGQSSRIRHSYLRIIMLACAGPNQLNQQELQMAFDAFAVWAGQVQMHEEVDPHNSNRFVINLSRDHPPLYKERFDGDEQDYLLELDFSHLIASVTARRKFPGAQALPPELTRHLIDMWETGRERQQNRRPVKTLVDVCVGLADCHYHLAGGKSFASFTGQVGSVDGAEAIEQAVLTGFTPAERRPMPKADAAPAPERVTVQNISSTGYCLYWHDAVPQAASAGQLLGIRDAGQNKWHLAVVRWIKQLRNASQMGVQVLALNAKPAAVSLMYDMGGRSEPMRALLIPADTAERTSATLVTAAALLQDAHNLHLLKDRGTLQIKLDKCVFATSKLRQFSYHVTASQAQEATTTAPDSYWK